MKKLILATLTIATLASFGYFQHSIGGTCPRTSCDGPKKITASATRCVPGSDNCPQQIESTNILATTCNGSDADCSYPKIIESIDADSTPAACGDPLCCGGGSHIVASIIIHCSQADSFGGCVDSNLVNS